MNTEPQVYFAYMVRVWRVNQPPSAGVLAGWRASLECPQTGKQIGFGSLQELFTFLSEEVMRCEATDAHKHQATG